MLDLKLNADWDLDISTGDLRTTDSIVQAVKIRLLWFFNEWRLGPDLGFPWFEDVLVKNPNIGLIKSKIRNTILEVKEVRRVDGIAIGYDPRTRQAVIIANFTTDKANHTAELAVDWPAGVKTP